MEINASKNSKRMHEDIDYGPQFFSLGVGFWAAETSFTARDFLYRFARPRQSAAPGEPHLEITSENEDKSYTVFD